MALEDDLEWLFRGDAAAAGPDDEAGLPEEESARRVAVLKGVLVSAERYWRTGAEELDLMTERLADGSRDGESRSLAKLETLLRLGAGSSSEMCDKLGVLWAKRVWP